MENKNVHVACERTEEQRFMALKHAFDILDLFAYPTLSADEMHNYHAIKQVLLKAYKPENTDWLKMMYTKDLQNKLPE